jgi:hypothetical protein
MENSLFFMLIGKIYTKPPIKSLTIIAKLNVIVWEKA